MSTGTDTRTSNVDNDAYFEAPYAGTVIGTWYGVPARCDQVLVGWAKVGPGRLDVLVQPEDVHPDTVARCDCLYDLYFAVSGVSPGAVTVQAWQRGDEYAGPTEPVLVSTGQVDVP